MAKKQSNARKAATENEARDLRDDLVRSAIASAILLIENEDQPELAANVLRLARDAIEAGAV